MCAVWTVGFVIKLLAVAFGTSFYKLENETILLKNGATNYGTACLLGFCDFLTIVIPIFCVVEDRFVTLMTGRFLLYANGLEPKDDEDNDFIISSGSGIQLR